MTASGSDGRGNVRPFPGAHPGSLTTGSGDALPVRAYERADDSLMLVLMVDAPTDAAAGLESEPALLEYTCQRGLVRVKGEARFQDRDLVRFETTPDREVLQRRDHVRVSSPQTVTLALGGGDQGLRAHTVDLSGGGMLLCGVEGLEPGERVSFSLDLAPGEAPVLGSGRVVRVGGSDRCALVFEEMSERERERLIRHVFEVLRQSRARTRADRA